ncbi:MAG: LTA synthase family protein, partial [Sediminibacterium sp.]|nr:LTA synthase family protein [Sediminibacterium sp.]
MIFIFVCVFFIYGKIDQYPLRWSDAFALGNNTASVIALNPMQSFFSSLSFIQAQYDAQKVKAYYGYIKEMYHLNNGNKELDYTNKIENCNNPLIPKNVVVVICESFSYYKSSVGNNHLNTTPFFKSLTKNGILFNRCFTPHIGTARGVWSILTNIPDVQLFKTATRNPAMVNQKLLLNNFTNNNFYFIGGSASWANIRGLLTNNIKNLQLFEGKDFNHPTEDVWGISDKNLLLEANKKLAQQTSPFTAIIQTADNHRPYTIPAEDKAAFTLWNIDTKTLNENGFASNEELNAFRYVDFCIEQFILTAKKEKYFDETLFVFVGDHGIAGNAGTQFPNAWTEGGLTANHVPLLFYAPAYLEPKQYNFLCSQLDVMPTIAGLLHKNVFYQGLGKNILSDNFLKNDTAHNTI